MYLTLLGHFLEEKSIKNLTFKKLCHFFRYSLYLDKNEQILTKVIAAEGEHKASRALKHAAEVIADSPAALQVGLLLIFSLLSAVSSTHRPFQIICHLSK